MTRKVAMAVLSVSTALMTGSGIAWAAPAASIFILHDWATVPARGQE